MTLLAPDDASRPVRNLVTGGTSGRRASRWSGLSTNPAVITDNTIGGIDCVQISFAANAADRGSGASTPAVVDKTGIGRARTYTMRAYVQSPTALNISCVAWGTASASGPVLVPNTWQWVTFTWTETAGSTTTLRNVGFGVIGGTAGTELLYVARLQVVEGSVAPTDFSDGDSLGWKWTGTAAQSDSVGWPEQIGHIRNLVPNPTGNVNPANWNHSAGSSGTATQTRLATGSPFGGPCVRDTWTGAGTPGLGGDLMQPSTQAWGGQQLGATAPVTVGKTYMASVFVRPSKQVSLRLEMQGITGNAGASILNGADTTCPANLWTKLSVGPWTVPAGTNAIRLDIDNGSNAANTWAIGDTLDYAGLMLYEGSTLLPYRDGDTRGWHWLGASGGSVSAGPNYTLDQIAGTPLFDYTGTANVLLDPAAFDPVANGVAIFTVTNLPALPAANAADNVVQYGTNVGGTFSDVAVPGPYNNFIGRYLGTSAGTGVTFATRWTTGLAISTPQMTTAGRYIAVHGVTPGAAAPFVGYSLSNTLVVDSTASFTALQHGRIWVPNNPGHTIVRVIGVSLNRATSITAQIMQIMAWLARMYGAAVPAGY